MCQGQHFLIKSPLVTIVSFIIIEDGVAQEVKRQVDIEAAAMTTEEDA